MLVCRGWTPNWAIRALAVPHLMGGSGAGYAVGMLAAAVGDGLAMLARRA